MITWSDIPLGWSIICDYGNDGRACAFRVIRRSREAHRCHPDVLKTSLRHIRWFYGE